LDGKKIKRARSGGLTKGKGDSCLPGITGWGKKVKTKGGKDQKKTPGKNQNPFT